MKMVLGIDSDYEEQDYPLTKLYSICRYIKLHIVNI